jgi:uncharacterized protein involved in exopolysaccharide biosynthesis
MTSDQPGLAEYLSILTRRSLLISFIGLLIFLAFIVLALTLPSVYLSSGTILIEQQQIPQDIVRSVITTDAAERIQLIRRRVMTYANLVEIIDEHGLYTEERKKYPMETIVEQMRQDVSIEPVSADVVDQRSGRPTQITIAFTVGYESPLARTAQRVANALVTLFLNENLRERTEAATGASQFLSEEAVKLGAQVAELEAKLADFKEENVENLPELRELNWKSLDRTQQLIDQINREINAREQQKAALETDLRRIAATASDGTFHSQQILGPEDRLSVLETCRSSGRHSDAEGDRLPARGGRYHRWRPGIGTPVGRIKDGTRVHDREILQRASGRQTNTAFDRIDHARTRNDSLDGIGDISVDNG